jgi:D-beta-D-heptose 7-phosphate kinase/D-beta-D-heptose 1-phosphate adenosyltransferase
MQTTNIWVNGCFDILHVGHIELLKYAKSLGSVLIVGIDSDDRIRSSKGPNRPFNGLKNRKRFLESIRYVDRVVSYSSDIELEKQLSKNKIDIMVIGSDWKGKKVVGEKIVKKVVFFDRIGKHSTTRILNNEICN